MAENNYKKLIERRHPAYEETLAHWDFVESTYNGGREWFAKNIFKYVKEGQDEFQDRLKRAYRFNHTREVVDLVNKYLFKVPITRRVDDSPEAVKSFWLKATKNELDIDAFMRRVSIMSSIYGRVWIVVDRKGGEAEGQLSRADAQAAGGDPYAYFVTPQHVLDMSYDENGKLRWILIHEVGRDDADPHSSTGKPVHRYRLWTTTGWELYVVKKEGRKTVVDLEDLGDHNLGIVPVIPADHVVSEELYTAPGMVDDVAYLDRAVANYLSNLDAIIQDQTFSQLAMPAQGLLPGEKGFDKLVEMGTKRIFTYDGESGAMPFYLSPDVKQAQLILSAIVRIISEIYHSVGLSAERTKDDNGGGVDNASGVAKGYDFERTNALLTNKADAMEAVENRLVALVMLWTGDTDEPHAVKYPDNFDTRGLYDELELAARLLLVSAPDGVRREQMTQLIDKLFPGLSADAQKKLQAELKSWPPENPALSADPSSVNGVGPDQARAAGAQQAAKELTA